MFQDLVEGVAKDLDEDGWRVVLENLRFAWTVCVGGKKSTPSSSQEDNSESTQHLPFKSWTEKSDHSLTLPCIQTRCQVLISLQRVMHKIHQKHGHLLLLEMHSELTGLLLEAVQQVTEANKDPEFINAVRTCLLEFDHSTGLEISAKTNSFQKSEIQEVEEEEIQETSDKTLVKLPSVKVDPSQSSPTQSSASPQLEELPELKTSVLGTHSSFHGLLKLQLEGGMLTIEALRRQASYKGETEQLYSFCRSVIIEASSEIRRSVANDGQEGSNSHWEQAMKAPLISKAFDIYQGAEGEVLLTELKELGPHLSTLVCSRELSIRQSVANLLKSKASVIVDLRS